MFFGVFMIEKIKPIAYTAYKGKWDYLGTSKKFQIDLIYSPIYAVIFGVMIYSYPFIPVVLVKLIYSNLDFHSLLNFPLFDFAKQKEMLSMIFDFQDGGAILVVLILLFFSKVWFNFSKKITGHIVGLPVKACISLNYETQRKQNDMRYAKTVEENHKMTVRRTREIEEAKAEGQAEAMLKMYKGQLSLLQDHKKRGVDIERETFDLRKKLLELESDENEKMINDLLKTLDRL